MRSAKPRDRRPQRPQTPATSSWTWVSPVVRDAVEREHKLQCARGLQITNTQRMARSSAGAPATASWSIRSTRSRRPIGPPSHDSGERRVMQFGSATSLEAAPIHQTPTLKTRAGSPASARFFSVSARATTDARAGRRAHRKPGGAIMSPPLPANFAPRPLRRPARLIASLFFCAAARAQVNRRGHTLTAISCGREPRQREVPISSHHQLYTRPNRSTPVSCINSRYRSSICVTACTMSPSRSRAARWRAPRVNITRFTRTTFVRPRALLSAPPAALARTVAPPCLQAQLTNQDIFERRPCGRRKEYEEPPAAAQAHRGRPADFPRGRNWGR